MIIIEKIKKILIDFSDQIIKIETNKDLLVQSINKEDIEELKRDLQDYFCLNSTIERVEFSDISEDQEAYLLTTAYVYTPNQVKSYTDSILLDNDRKLNEVIRSCLI